MILSDRLEISRPPPSVRGPLLYPVTHDRDVSTTGLPGLGLYAFPGQAIPHIRPRPRGEASKVEVG